MTQRAKTTAASTSGSFAPHTRSGAEATLSSSTPTELSDGGVVWRNERGEIHREDGPAFERPNGTREWWVDGRVHREDGPAVEYANGGRRWYQNGVLHREDGPAYEGVSGYSEWWVNGEFQRYENVPVD